MKLGFQGNNDNGRKPLATLGNLKLACVELGIPDDKHTLRRAARAFDLYHSGKVEHLNNHTFNVKSQYAERFPYQVWISPTGTSYCTCPDWMNYSGDKVVPDIHFHCKHAIAARVWLHNNGNGSKIENEAKVKYQNGSRGAAEIEAKLNGDNGSNGNNGTGDNPVHHQLDISNPFQESEQRDIDQIEGRSWRVRSHALGDLVHKLSNGEYVISYRGIMALAEQHGVTFIRHTVKPDAKRNGTVIAYARLGNNTRASGKPMNGSFITAVELAKRNAARQLISLPEQKALVHKFKLEAEFSWEQAKKACLAIVPKFKLSIIIDDMVKEGKLKQAHVSDYKRKEWLAIHRECKRDAETNGNDDDDNNEPSEFPNDTEVPENADDFIAECKKAEAEVDDTVSQDYDDDITAKDVEDMPLENSCAEVESHGEAEASPVCSIALGVRTAGKRKLQMGKDRIIWLIEVDGTKKQISYPEAGKLNRNSVLRLTQGIACGADISTVELSACDRTRQ